MIVKKRELSDQAPLDTGTHVDQFIPSLAYIAQGLVGSRLTNQLTGKAEGTHQ
jgi:hypothetical protein